MFIYLIWTSVIHTQVLRSFICVGKPDIDLTVLSGITHKSMSFGGNRAEVFNYNMLYPFKNYLNLHFQDGLLKKFGLLLTIGSIKRGIKISVKLHGGKNRCVKNAVK